MNDDIIAFAERMDNIHAVIPYFSKGEYKTDGLGNLFNKYLDEVSNCVVDGDTGVSFIHAEREKLALLACYLMAMDNKLELAESAMKAGKHQRQVQEP